MRNEDCPNPPADLRNRCLETIPASATRRPMRPHLSLEMPSQSRLRWLTLAAAIPVVTVLAIMPLRNYLTAKARSKDVIVTTEATDLPEKAKKMKILCFRLVADFLPVNPNPSRTNWFGKSDYQRVGIWDAKSGYYSGTWINGNQDPDNMRHSGTLALSDGAVYQRTGDSVTRQQRPAEAYIREFCTTVRDLFDPKYMTARLSGYGEAVIHADGTREDLPVLVEKRVRGQYAGSRSLLHPKAVEVCVCVQHPSRGMAARGAPIIRIRFYRDLKTGLLYGYDMKAYWQEDSNSYWSGDSHTQETPIDVGEGQYEYYDDLTHHRDRIMDKNYFLENSRIVTDSVP